MRCSSAQREFAHRLPQSDVRLGAHARRDRSRSAGGDRLGRLGRRREALQRQRRRQRSAEAQRRRVPHLDDRRASDVQPHQRAAAHLVRRPRAPASGRCPRPPRRRRSRRRREENVETRGDKEWRAKNAPVPSEGSTDDDEPVLAGQIGGRDRARRRQRVRRRGGDDQAAAQERRPRRSSPPRPGRGRGRCRRGGAPAPRRTSRPASSVTAISRASSRAVNISISGPMCSATREVAATTSRRDSAPDSATDRRACSARPEDLPRQRREPPAARRQRDPAAVADEQFVAELLAQRGDRDRHRGLGDLELGGRRLDRSVAGDEHEGLQLSEGHK